LPSATQLGQILLYTEIIFLDWKGTMQKIVYILGAGFSKPLGLPIMSDFIDMAKDLYTLDTQKYSYFSNVFKFIHDRLAWVKTVYDADLNNIEEILSILEMLNILDKIEEKDVLEYKKFLIDVIDYYTPRFSIPAKLRQIEPGAYLIENNNLQALLRLKVPTSHLVEEIFPSSLVKNYLFFVLGLFNAKLNFTLIEHALKITCTPIENPYAEYSIITLNYDLVLEKIASFLSSFAGKQIQFSSGATTDKFPVIVHLHGSVDNKNIIPPTWQKTIEKNIEEHWRTAYEILGSANHIRIIGYSLPITDAYIRYLLKASILKNNTLKSINVLCLDRWGTIKKRYDEFIQLPPEKYQFSNIDVTDHLASVASRVINNSLMDDLPSLPSNDWVHPYKSNF